ncbi:MAG: hypothetical protein HY736_12335 [Verrucomicrobia bacterium]|nr:hypothetical protein [Verrucomicrobiota bacterium]
MKNRVLLAFAVVPGLCSGSNLVKEPAGERTTIENAELRLVIGNDGKAVSLLHKPSGQECLQPDAKRCNNAAVFSITEYRPYNGEVHLVYPSKTTAFEANSVHRVGDDLIVGFERSHWLATISLRITDSYIGFTLKKLDFVEGYGDNTRHPVDEVTFLQLPVRNRKFFGEWLNVIWDEDVAVNVLGTDPYARIDGVKYNDYTLLQATAVREVKALGVGAALITTGKDNLLDRIDRLERDLGLPLGVKSRRNDAIRHSYLWLQQVSPESIDEYIAIAKRAGLRGVQIYWPAIFQTLGHYPWRPEFPNGMADLKTITRKIADAGMIPGFHMQHSKASITDLYVSPVPDHRLNLLRMFTLAAPLDKEATTVTVEENPEGCDLMTAVMWNKKQVLKIGSELVEYATYTPNRPYQFTGCKRGILNTASSAYPLGHKLGLLDIDGQAKVRFDQRTGIQSEHAERIGKISNEAGFRFFSYDGAEDVHAPWWFHVSMSQLEVHKRLVPEPLFSVGAAKSHFGWHILTSANEFDTFKPEVVKAATRKHQVAAAKYLAQDFTRVNFGWLDYVAPNEGTIGMQPDMYEYICSRATAWDCPISLKANLRALRTHPRTDDNLEVIRRWEEARLSRFFSDEQRGALQEVGQEHILLINETGGFELQPYDEVPDAAGGSPSIRAFIFNRAGKTHVVFWHPSGEGNLELNIDAGRTRLFKQLGREIPVRGNSQRVSVPYGERQYLEIDRPRENVVSALREARVF